MPKTSSPFETAAWRTEMKRAVYNELDRERIRSALAKAGIGGHPENVIYAARLIAREMGSGSIPLAPQKMSLGERDFIEERVERIVKSFKAHPRGPSS